MGPRLAGLLVGLLLAGQPALAQDSDNPRPAIAAAPKPAAKPATSAAPANQEHTGTVKRGKQKPAKPAKNAANLAALKQAYDAMPDMERLAIQSDLAWVGDYNGLVDGDFNERSIAAVKAFQKRNKSKETGLLAPQERASLAAAAKAPQEAVGWRLIDDFATGARLGLPFKLAPQPGTALNGSRWSSAQGQIQIETFRLREAALPAVFEQQKKTPPQREIGYSVLNADFFVVSGLQGLKRFYVRAQAKDGEVRGLTVLYDQATEGIMAPVVVAMSNAFQAFPGPNAAPLPGQRRRVEYGSAIVVGAAGALIADRQLTDECQALAVPGYGHAERIAQDEASGLALLRIYGARHLAPVQLGGEPAEGVSVTLVGIADPQAQAGGGAVSKVAARLSALGVEPTPRAGFSGAAAVDPNGRVVGMVGLRAPVVASAGAASVQAVLVPATAIRAFLQAHNVAPAGGGTSVERAVLRVVCVRK
jgi:peptidoglycan hydrolase-like protein with peptidoglycan-binding domain